MLLSDESLPQLVGICPGSCLFLIIKFIFDYKLVITGYPDADQLFYLFKPQLVNSVGTFQLCNSFTYKFAIVNNQKLMVEYQWFAAYTNPRSEKKAYKLLKEQGITTYLPLIKRMKQWSDRRKKVEEPLIRSYIFVKISEREYFKVLNTQHVIRFVTFEGKAVPIPEDQIETVKKLLSTDTEVDVIDTPMEEGDEVRVAKGPLLGLKGELVEYKQRKRVMVKLEHTGKTLVVNLPLAFLEPMDAYT